MRLDSSWREPFPDRPGRNSESKCVLSPLPHRPRVFPTEYAHPATRARILLLAGDVETNPSPTRKRGQRGGHKHPVTTASSIKLPPLRILQLNCNGAISRHTELAKRLETWKPDIVLLQETKIPKDGNTKSLSFKDYEAFLKPRELNRAGTQNTEKAGGLATLIRRDSKLSITFPNARPTAPNDITTEWQSAEVTTHLGKTFSFLNIYVPPCRPSEDDQRVQNFSPGALPFTENLFIAGDFNCHSQAWDPFKDEDEMGTNLENITEDNLFIPANTGSGTRIDPQNGNPSTPDIFFHHHCWTDKISWQVKASVGSDHLPIIIDIDMSRPTPPIHKKSAWAYKKADWDSFTSKVTDSLQEWDPSANPAKANKNLITTIIDAANNSIPRGSSHPTKAWWNAEINTAVEARNAAAGVAHQSPENHERWRTLTAEASKLISSGKKKNWQEYASTLNANSDPRKVWSTIKGLDDRNKVPTSCAAMKSGNKTITGDNKIASQFVSDYVSWRKLPKSPTDSNIKRQVNSRIREPCRICEGRHTETCKPFSLTEIQSAIKSLKSRKAPGRDGISNEMLQHLGPKGTAAFLDICNLSWSTSCSYDNWKKDDIIPIRKAGKPPDETSSYRPISLTSSMGKVMEKLVKNRLQTWLENNNQLSNFQAGFRKLRSTEDQIARISQRIIDGLKLKKPALRSIITLVDFTRAFDTVWRDALYQKMLNKGIPTCYIKWTKCFLADRRARVIYGNGTSNDRNFRQGLPQGSVLSPLLFLIYIDDLASSLPADSEPSLFADDLATISQGHTLASAQEAAQRALDAVAAWASKWKLAISIAKTETTLITPWNKERANQINLTLYGHPVKTNATPTFLGITFDRELTFKAHLDKVTKKASGRLQQLRAISGRDWGADTKTLRTLYITYIRSAIGYGAAYWLPRLSDTNLLKTETLQNRAARIITGCVAGTPTIPLLTEANLQPLSIWARELAGNAYERFLRTPDSNPTKSIALAPEPRNRLSDRKGRNWRTVGRATSEAAGLTDLPRLQLHPTSSIHPWSLDNQWNVTIYTTLPIHKTDSIDQKKETALRELALLPKPYISVWTDGSAEEGFRNGGSVILIEHHSTNTETKLSFPAGHFTSSFQAEAIAMLRALQFITNNTLNPGKSITIHTDSQSLLTKLRNGPLNQRDPTIDCIVQCLLTISHQNRHTTLQWVPAHVGIEGNETVDTLAKEGTLLDQGDCPIDINSAFAAIHRHLNKEWSTIRKSCPDKEEGSSTLWHHKVTAGDPLPINDASNLSRRDRVTLHQIRTGRSPLALDLKGKLRGTPTTCQMCGTLETVEHILLICPLWSVARIRHLDGPSPPPSTLQENARGILLFLREIGRI